MVNGFADALELPTDMLNVLEWPALFSMEPLQTIFDLLISTFPLEEVIKTNKDQNLCSLLVNHSVESVDKEESSVGKVG